MMKAHLTLAFSLLLLCSGTGAWAAKVKICHVPPGNPANFHTITVDDSAVQAHLGHGDLLGSCFEHCDQLCDDGNACTIDACDANEHCAATHPPVNCDDGNLCTVDSCDPALGCASPPKVCQDTDLCTVDTCDPLTGSCAFPPVACPAGQTCNPSNGNCESTDLCTPNPCVHGECEELTNGYACLCEPGWTGTNCDIPDPCTGVVCTAIDQCHDAGVCSNGVCSNPPKPDGTSCVISFPLPSSGVCRNGACSPF